MHFESIQGKFKIQIPGNLIEDVPPKFAGILKAQNWHSIYGEGIYGIEYCLFNQPHNNQEITSVLDLMINTMKDSYFTEGEISDKTFFQEGMVDCLQSVVFGKPNQKMHEYFETYHLSIQTEIVYRIGVLCLQENHVVEAFMSTTNKEQLKWGKKYLSTLQLNF